MPSALFQSVFPELWVAAHMHHSVDHYAISLYTIVNTEWKTLDEIASHIIFDYLPSAGIGKDLFDAGLEGFDKRLRHPRTDVSIIGDSSKVFFKRLRMERVLHLLMILCANTEASLPSTGSTIPLFISSRRRLTVST